MPINSKSFILIGGWSYRCFTKSDEKWINNWSKKVNNIFIKNSF
ncbi:cofactor assembly of complex C subunit B [Prochlorococcus sp. AH-716-O22]|nr:cofactor assembly of complex C subunit B [Prochlorococcus sp. AH-716-O22]